MAVSLISTVGSATANSYVNVASANTYFEVRQDSDVWDDLSDASTGTVSASTTKAALLIQASREIDRTFRFFGGKEGTGRKGASDYQNLEFPRSNTIDTDGNVIIPDEIKEATYEQAIWIRQRNATQVTEEGETIKQPKFSELAYDLIKPWFNRQVAKQGKYTWEGSYF